MAVIHCFQKIEQLNIRSRILHQQELNNCVQFQLLVTNGMVRIRVERVNTEMHEQVFSLLQSVFQIDTSTGIMRHINQWQPQWLNIQDDV